MKKIASLIGAGALLLSMVGGVFADNGGPDEAVLVVNKGSAMQITGSAAVANSGLNAIVAGMNGDDICQSASIKTGDALASAGTQAIANQFVTKVKYMDSSFTKGGSFGPGLQNGVMPSGDGSVKVINDGRAFQLTGSLALASSGVNAIAAGMNRDDIYQKASIKTGDAVSVSETQAWANIFDTKVTSISSNTNIGSMRPPCCGK